MIKKLFCKHDYHYFHEDEYLDFFSSHWYTQWHYVCKNCGKTSTIKEDVLKDYSRRISKKVKKEEVFGKDNSMYKDMEFHLGCYTFRGKNAYYMKQIYSKYHQDKPIPRYS